MQRKSTLESRIYTKISSLYTVTEHMVITQNATLINIFIPDARECIRTFIRIIVHNKSRCVETLCHCHALQITFNIITPTHKIRQIQAIKHSVLNTMGEGNKLSPCIFYLKVFLLHSYSL